MLINFVDAINDANHYTKPPTMNLWVMNIARRLALKVNVKGQNAVGATSTEGSTSIGVTNTNSAPHV